MRDYYTKVTKIQGLQKALVSSCRSRSTTAAFVQGSPKTEPWDVFRFRLEVEPKSDLAADAKDVFPTL